MFLQSRLLSLVPRLTHGFGTLTENVPAPFLADWEAKRPRWQQVHKTACIEVTGPAQVSGEVDALWSRAPGIPISVMTADCTPVLLARKDGSAVAAAHAGWRGTQARILDALWAKLAEQGERAADWVGVIGPTIGPCCYEVSVEIADDFAREFGGYGAGVAVPRHRHLDLPAINEAQLRELGLTETEILRACTRCTGLGTGLGTGASAVQPMFHSYRREGGGTRQYSVLAIGGPESGR
jgi:YfiH family protein